jgi:hypothetical protein
VIPAIYAVVKGVALAGVQALAADSGAVGQEGI